MSYADFIARKLVLVPPSGLANPPALSSTLFPFQRDVTKWALRRGRAAIFADCGLGKTLCQLEWAQTIHEETRGNVLVLAPLAVAQQTVTEALKFDIPARYVRSQADVQSGITLANYEMLDRFDPSKFVGVVLDESSILKSYDGKTRTAIIEAFRSTPYRLACTATPAPNDFMELGNHAEFLGVISRTEMLATYFVHDGGSTQDWRLKGHAEQDFWRWVCSWAVMIRKPSDLGYDDSGFVLPSLEIVSHVVRSDPNAARHTGMLFPVEARTLVEQRMARRESLPSRVEECVRVVRSDVSTDQWIVWCELNDEQDALAEAFSFECVSIRGADDRHAKVRKCTDWLEGRVRILVSKPSVFGYGMNFQRCHRVAFVGVNHSHEMFYQAVRRCWRFGQHSPVDVHVISSDREGAVLSSLRRKEADAQRMADAMLVHMASVQRVEVSGTARESIAYAPAVAMRIPEWLVSEAS